MGLDDSNSSGFTIESSRDVPTYADEVTGMYFSMTPVSMTAPERVGKLFFGYYRRNAIKNFFEDIRYRFRR